MSKIPFFKFFSKSKFSVSDKNNFKNNVGWAFSPTLKYCWGRNPNLHKNSDDLIGKKSINSSPSHPELVSGSYHLQEYTDFNINKSNVGVETPTYNNISLNTKERSIIWQCLRLHSPRKIAFTLAEVLITLGIIGVVAAMTLPTLIANGRKTETISRLKKFNSTMQQALLMAQKDYGEPKYWDKNDDYMLEDENGNPILDENGKVQTDFNKSSKQAYDFLMKYILPYIKYTKIVEEYETETRKFVAIYFQDGSIAYVKNGVCIDFMFDVNGKNRPNQVGIDRFYFYIAAWNPVLYFGNKNAIWGTYGLATDRNNRSEVLAQCRDSIPHYCTRLIEMDGWEFKDDYPYKL